MSGYVDPYAHRQAVNDQSRSWAKRHKVEWTTDEDEFIVEYWIDVDPADRDEVTVAQCIERTVESCRNRAEIIRKERGWDAPRPSKHDDAYQGVMDDPEDQWWSPEYYNQEGK